MGARHKPNHPSGGLRVFEESVTQLEVKGISKPRPSRCQPAKSLLAPADVRSLGLFFKALLESKRLTALAAIAACGSILGGLHVLRLAIRWLARF